MYIAETEAGAFVETYLRNPKGVPVYLSAESLRHRHFTIIAFMKPLRLIDLTGPGLVRVGVDARLMSGDPALSQRWALAFWNHPDRPDGILYRSRHDSEMMCCAVFDRRDDAHTAKTLGTLADPANAEILGPILERYGVALI
ncbi:RES domain protein [compost metagenome]